MGMSDIWLTAASSTYYSAPGSMIQRDGRASAPTPATTSYLSQSNAGALPGTRGAHSADATSGAQNALAAHYGVSTFYASSDGDPFHHGPGYR